ncbi:MAG: hypothetical protein HGA71_20585, partial [Azonexaceae bacterium]|nr:hypothetical protein [Azonexaceae bacterium]
MQDPCVFVIFGSTGHLSRTKLLPSLYNLDVAGRLPERIAILCVGRRPWDTAKWREEVTHMLEERLGERMDRQKLPQFLERVHYFLGDISDDDFVIGKPDADEILDAESKRQLKARLQAIAQEREEADRNR